METRDEKPSKKEPGKQLEMVIAYEKAKEEAEGMMVKFTDLQKQINAATAVPSFDIEQSIINQFYELEKKIAQIPGMLKEIDENELKKILELKGNKGSIIKTIDGNSLMESGVEKLRENAAISAVKNKKKEMRLAEYDKITEELIPEVKLEFAMEYKKIATIAANNAELAAKETAKLDQDVKQEAENRARTYKDRVDAKMLALQPKLDKYEKKVRRENKGELGYIEIQARKKAMKAFLKTFSPSDVQECQIMADNLNAATARVNKENSDCRKQANDIETNLYSSVKKNIKGIKLERKKTQQSLITSPQDRDAPETDNKKNKLTRNFTKNKSGFFSSRTITAPIKENENVLTDNDSLKTTRKGSK